jgi:hypothetical protein
MLLEAPALTPILIVAHNYLPENIIGAYRPARFQRYLPQFGYSASVLTASPQPPGGTPGVWTQPFSHNLIEALFFKTFFPYDERMTWLPGALRLGQKILQTPPSPRLIFSTSPPISNHYAARHLARKFRLPWVADFRDPLVANFSRRAPLSRWVDRQAEATFVRDSQAIIMNTVAAAEELRTRYPRAAAKIHAIPNGYDAEEAFPQLPLPPRPIPLWFHGGSLYLNRYPLRLLASLDRLDLQVQLQFVGVIEDPSLLDSPHAQSLRAQGRLCVDNQVRPKAEALRMASEANGTLIFDHFHAHGPNLAIPAKSFDCIRAGRPILAFTSPGSPLDTLLDYSGIPHVSVFEEDSPGQIDQKVRAFAALPSTFNSPSAEFVERHSAVAQTNALASLFDRLLSRSA